MPKKDFNKIGADRTKDDLIAHLEEESQVLRDENIKRAFRKVDRADFVPADYVVEAYEDYALPIGHDQTISQPTTVAFMLELLELGEGNTVLDVGSGSGWTTALLAEIVGREGEVLGLEIIPELVEQGQFNLDKYDYPQARIEAAPIESGIASTDSKQKYDRIMVSADAPEPPDELLAKLDSYGIMVVPIQGAIYKFKKVGDEIQEMRFPGFAFVPLK